MSVIQTALDERFKQLLLVVSTFEERGIYMLGGFFRPILQKFYCGNSLALFFFLIKYCSKY